MDMHDFMNSKRKNESLEVTGISRSGRVRKKSSKLVDFESTDEVDTRHKRRTQADKVDQSLTSKAKKQQKLIKNKVDEDEQIFPDNEEINNSQESDTESDVNQSQEDEEEFEGDEDDNEEDGGVADDDDDEDDDNENEVDEDYEDDDNVDEENDDNDEQTDGQLVMDEKTPTQSLYMMEKSKKKLVIKDGKVVGTAKAHRKDKGKARFTAYMMWAKEIRKELNKQYPDMDFTTMARRLSELWGTVPNSERELWRRKAKREAAKKHKSKQEAPLMPSRKFINKKGTINLPPVNSTPVSKPIVSPPESQQQMGQIKKTPEVIMSPGLYKVTGISPIDVAAHLKLLGESLFIIGERLQEHEGQIAVSGSLSVLLDSLLCAVGPLLCLTQQVEEMKSNEQVLSKILQNVAYMMPGLG